MLISIFKDSLKARLTLILILVALIPLVVVTAISYYQARQALQLAALREVTASTRATSQDIQTFITQFKADVLSLSQTPPVQGIIRARANDGLDPETNETYDAWVEQLNQIFVPVAESKKFYQQIRYLNEAGLEMVRVDFNGWRAIIRSGNELEDKSLRPYFGETIQLPSGEIYISELNLNRERGEVQVPHTPVLRYATPIHDSDGKRKGIVILNVYADYFLDRLRTESADVAKIYLTSQEGYYLQHPDQEQKFGFDLGKPFNAESDFAWAISQMGGQNTFTGIDPDTGQIVSLEKIYFDPHRTERYWLLIRELSGDVVLAGINDLRFYMAVVIGIGTVLLVLIAIWLANTITRPVTSLAGASERIAGGDWDVPLPTAGSDEIGRLINGFSRMVGQIQEMFARLESQNERRIHELEAGAEISRQLTTILDIDVLLHQVVTSIQNAFDYYHVHIYLIDEDTGELIMREGTGEVGRQLKAKGHKLQLGQGIVGRVASSKEAFLAKNVNEVPGFFRNPLLPKTRAELAVPLHKGDVVLGVLDMQSEKIGGFSQEDLTLMQSIADQVAVAVDNAHLFQEAQNALAEAEATHQQYVARAWEGFRETHPVLRAEQQEPGIKISTHDTLSAIRRQAIQQGKIVMVDPQTTEDSGNGNASQAALVAPLKLRGQVIGTLGLQEIQPGRRWTEEEIALVEAVSEQVSQALERARLFDDTQQRAAREKVVADVTGRVWASGELERVMQTAVEQLGFVLDASKVVIRLGTEDQLGQDQ